MTCELLFAFSSFFAMSLSVCFRFQNEFEYPFDIFPFYFRSPQVICWVRFAHLIGLRTIFFSFHRLLLPLQGVVSLLASFWTVWGNLLTFDKLTYTEMKNLEQLIESTYRSVGKQSRVYTDAFSVLSSVLMTLKQYLHGITMQ